MDTPDSEGDGESIGSSSNGAQLLFNLFEDASAGHGEALRAEVIRSNRSKNYNTSYTAPFYAENPDQALLETNQPTSGHALLETYQAIVGPARQLPHKSNKLSLTGVQLDFDNIPQTDMVMGEESVRHAPKQTTTSTDVDMMPHSMIDLQPMGNEASANQPMPAPVILRHRRRR